MRIVILIVTLALCSCAERIPSTSEIAGQVTNCTGERGTWPCIGDEFHPQLDALAPADDAPLWSGCDKRGTCCVGAGDGPSRGGYACCQHCDSIGPTKERFCLDVICGRLDEVSWDWRDF